MSYERLLIESEEEVSVKEKPLEYGFKGIYKSKKIIIDKNIDTTSEKACILAEELGHHFTSSGNILDQSRIENRKQELIARRWAYKKLIGITDIVQASKQGIRNRHELAEYLGITEEFLNEALKYYKDKYGLFYEIDNYIVYFEPLGVLEKIF